jgi:hypothetical protein
VSDNLLESVFTSVTKDWKRAKRQAGKDDRVSRAALNRMRTRPARVAIRDVAFSAMEMAYLKASGGGRYSANARQIYYAARPAILTHTGADSLDSKYFTQTLLKDYLEIFHPAWDVVWDDRGHLEEPHTGKVIGLGGLAVREYIGDFTTAQFDERPAEEPQVRIPTEGPALRYGGVLFVEKEGFNPLLKESGILERYDLALASTKGMPVTALCDLLGTLRQQGRKVYVLHDFDKAGFSIAATLRHGTRGARGFGHVVDLGFRLEDIEGLEREAVSYGRTDPRYNLRENGATAEERAILASRVGEWGYFGERVELNAMMADQFVEWIERKLLAADVTKLIPEADALASAYRRARFLQALEEQAKKLREEFAEKSWTAPDDLPDQLTALLAEHPAMSWDEAVWALVEAE